MGATTPLADAQAQPTPDRPFESANQFQHLQPDESSDDGSHNSAALLLTPADGDDAIPTPTAKDIVGAIGDGAGDIAPPPADVVSPVSAPAPTQLATGSQADFLWTIGDLFETKLAANAAELKELKRGFGDLLDTKLTATTAELTRGFANLICHNATRIDTLSTLVDATAAAVSTMTARLDEITDTANRAFKMVSRAGLTFTSQGDCLNSLDTTVSQLKSDFDVTHAPSKPSPELEAFILATVTETAATATASVEEAIRNSFGTSETTLDEKVTSNLTAFEKKIAHQGCSYGHITKTTLPDFARRLEALEARGQFPPTPPANKVDPPATKVDPSDDEPAGLTATPNTACPKDNMSAGVPAVDRDEDADDDEYIDPHTRSKTTWTASRARTGLGSASLAHLTPSRTQAPSNATGGSGRGLLRTPVVTPYHPSSDQSSCRQTTIPETMHGPRSVLHSKVDNAHDRSIDQRTCVQSMIDTAHDEPLPSRRAAMGPIVSPHHSDRAMHARTLGASRFDAIRLATEEYHGGMDGRDYLTEDDVKDSGYARIKASIEDVLICYNDIILVHQKVRELWYNAYAHTSGPQVDKILQKSLAVFPKLTSMWVDDVVNFYNLLQEVSMGYSLALMPFDAIVLKNKHKGLCPPGLGLIRYTAMCKGFMELLPRLVPDTLSPQINGVLASVCYESNNG
jgi:hypothetical protein